MKENSQDQKRDYIIGNFIIIALLRNPILILFTYMKIPTIGFVFFSTIYIISFLTAMLYVFVICHEYKINQIRFIFIVCIVIIVLGNCLRLNVQNYAEDGILTVVVFYLLPFSVLMLISDVNNLKNSLKKAIAIHYVIGIVISLLYIATGRGYDANAMLASYMIGLPTACIIFRSVKNENLRFTTKIFYLISAIIGIYYTIIGGSRGTLIVFAFAILGAFIYRKNKTKSFCIIIGGILLLMIFENQILNIMGNLMGNSRIIQFSLSNQLYVSDGRDKIWKLINNAIFEKPILGWGTYGDRYVIKQLGNLGTADYFSHNVFLEILCDYGIIIGGAFCVLIIGGSVYQMVIKKAELLPYVFLLAIPRLLVSSSFLESSYFWVFCGILILYCIPRYSQKNN